jgi:hypothetical protein
MSVVALLAGALAACDRPAADDAPMTALSGERYAHALLRAPTRKPCKAVECRTVKRSTLLAAGDSTYVAALVGRDSVLRRWPVRVGAPIRVWLEPARRGAAGNAGGVSDRERMSRVRGAFRRWEKVGVPVRFAFTRDSAEAEVRVRWVDSLPGPRAGFIRWTSDEHGWLTGAEVALARRDSTRRAYPLTVVDAVVTHEVGHLLGLEHSPDAGDVMAAQVLSGTPSERDRATARVLYSQPAGRVR